MSDLEYILKLSNLSSNEFIIYLQKMSSSERISLINNQYLKDLNDINFAMLFYNLSCDELTSIINNKEIFDKIINIPLNKYKKNVFEILIESNIPKLKLLLESNYINNHYDKFLKFILNMNNDKFEKLILNLDYDLSCKIYEDLINLKLVKINFNQEELLKYFFIVKRNPLFLIKTKNYKELLIYTKFNLIVNVENDKNDSIITLTNGFTLPIKILDNLKLSQIIKLMDMIKMSFNPSNEELFEISMKLYFIFGFDNAKKILDNKFTKMTEHAILRIINEKFKEHQREYRSLHPDHFVCLNLLKKVISKLPNFDDNVLKPLTFEENKEELENLKEKILFEYNRYKNEDISRKTLENLVNDILIDQIRKRDSKEKNKFSILEHERIINKCKNKTTLTLDDLENLFDKVDLYSFIKNFETEDINGLNKLLLGNFKSDNDCLLRLLINEEALGLNYLTSEIINKYKLISSITSDIKNKLSINSILDLIDIMKINFKIKLKPNQKDINLITLTKIKNSKKFCTKSDTEILSETLKLHIERKKKIYSSIPQVSGKYNEIEYFVAPFDAEYLLSAGVDSHNCLKISATGEELFRYCLTNPHAVIIYVKDGDDTYICPIIRSGNAIHCNGIDPEIKKERLPFIINALKDCFDKIISRNIKSTLEKPRTHQENIEVATLTNLHLSNYLDGKFPLYELERAVPIDYPEMYSDINKNDIKTYILSCSKTYNGNHYYLSKDRYYEKRNLVYEYYITEGLDKEKINLILNSILYSSIDEEMISPIEKSNKKRKFREIDVSNYKYVVGNKDWFLTVDNQYKIYGVVLKNDRRAFEEYKAASKKVIGMLYDFREREDENDREDNKKY